MSFESPRPPQEAERQNTAEMLAPTATPPDQVPASVTPTGAAGGRRRLGKSGPPGPARKGRTVAKRKPEKKRPAGAKKAAARKASRTGRSTQFREKEGWRTEPTVGGRKPSAAQRKAPPKKPGTARKTVAKSTAAKRATAKTAARGATAAKRPAKRATGRR
jgi:DNA-binding protein HU-beta